MNAIYRVLNRRKTIYIAYTKNYETFKNKPFNKSLPQELLNSLYRSGESKPLNNIEIEVVEKNVENIAHRYARYFLPQISRFDYDSTVLNKFQNGNYFFNKKYGERLVNIINWLILNFTESNYSFKLYYDKNKEFWVDVYSKDKLIEKYRFNVDGMAKPIERISLRYPKDEKKYKEDNEKEDYKANIEYYNTYIKVEKDKPANKIFNKEEII